MCLQGWNEKERHYFEISFHFRFCGDVAFKISWKWKFCEKSWTSIDIPRTIFLILSSIFSLLIILNWNCSIYKLDQHFQEYTFFHISHQKWLFKFHNPNKSHKVILPFVSLNLLISQWVAGIEGTRVRGQRGRWGWHSQRRSVHQALVRHTERERERRVEKKGERKW